MNNEIQGWMADEELDWLAGMARKSRKILEIGIWKGRSTSVICSNALGKVIAIDNWQGDPGDSESYIELNQGVDVEKIARDNLSHYLITRKLRIIKESSSTAWRNFSSKVNFDWIFIDGGHRYETVSSDISLYKRYLKPGGIISGHDIDLQSVAMAVKDNLGEVFNPIGKIWSKVI